MFESSMEELCLARTADYERLVRRLLLEREALAAAAEARPSQPHRHRLLGPLAWRDSSTAR